jgi:hypothetical protein
VAVPGAWHTPGRMRASGAASRIVQSALLTALLLGCFDLAWVYAGALLKSRALELLAEPTTAVDAYGTGLWALFVAASLGSGVELAIVALAGWLERRAPALGGSRALGLAAALVASPALLGLAVFLGRGGWASQYLSAWPARLALAALLAGLLVAALHGLLALRRRLVDRRPRLWRTLLALVACGLIAVDYRVLPDLYLPLHGLLMLLAALCLQQLLWDGMAAGWRRDGIALVVAAGLWMLALPVLEPWSSRPLANFYVAQFAPFAGKALRGIGVLREQARGVRPRTAAGAATAAAAPGSGVDLVDGHDLFILSVDGLSPFRASLPLPGRLSSRSTTPFLAELARDSVSFARHYTVYPNTEISLLSLLSGIPHDGARVPLVGGSARARLTRHFAARGYRTYCDVPYAEALFAQLRSAERCDALVNYAEADWNANGLAAFVANTEAPVFAIVHFVSTHKPYQRFAAHRFGPTSEDAYDEALAGTDAVLRRLYAELRRLSPTARFVFTSDHGHAFGWHGVSGHGSSVQEDQLRIPLLLHGFGLPAQRVERVSSVLDLFGLLTADPAQRELAAGLEAGSVSGPRPRPVQARLGTRQAVIAERYKLIVDPTVGSEALFDVSADPREQRNLIGALPGPAGALRAQLGDL